MRLRIDLFCALVLLFVFITNSEATTVMFTDESAWQKDVISAGYQVTNIDFESGVTRTDYGNIVRAGEVVFISMSPGVPLDLSPDLGIPYGSGTVLYPFMNQEIYVDLPDDTYAIGFDLGMFGGSANNDVPTLDYVSFSTGEFFGGYYGNPFPTYAFFGFLSDDRALTALRMHPHSSYAEPILDNFRYAQHIALAAPVPEPASLMLLVSGFFSVGVWRRCSKRLSQQ